MNDEDFERVDKYIGQDADKNALVLAHLDMWLGQRGSDEPFTARDIFTDLGFSDRANNYGFSQRHSIYNRLNYITNIQTPPLLERKGKIYRVINRQLEELAWWSADENNTLELKLPFGLHGFAVFYRPCLIIVAGLYNQGKTAFILNMLKLNLDAFANQTHLFVSEGMEQLKDRLRNLGVYTADKDKFKAYRRLANFSDVVDPEGLNLIDYLRVDPERPYTVATDLFAIFSKLTTGVAVVALQKPPKGEKKRGLAFGGAWTAFDPALYVCIDKEGAYKELTIERVKTPKPCEQDIYQMKIQFKISQGVNFVDEHTVYE